MVKDRLYSQCHFPWPYLIFSGVIGRCWIIGQQTIAERNVGEVEFRMKQMKMYVCTLKNLF